MDNYRRRGYGYQQPPQINPNLVDFGQLPMYNPQDTERLAQIGQQAQQRYDASQATIAKYLEDVSAADFSGLDQETRDRLMLELDTNAARIQDRVSKDYQGDYGRALPDILKGLSKDRGLMHQGIQESAKAKQAFADYQDLAKKGMAPQKFIPGQGLVTMSFEDYHEGRLPGFTEEGKFVGGQYAALRGASDLTGYLDKGISKKLSNRLWQDILRENEKTPGFLEQVSRKGYTNEQLEKYFNSPDFNKEDFVRQLKGEVPHLAAEFEGVPESELFDYAKNIIKTQVSEQLMRVYRQDPNYNPSPTNPNNPNIIHPYDTIVKPGNKNEKISSIENRFNTFRKNRQYILNAEDIKGKREALEPQIDITKVSEALKNQGTGLTQFTVNGLYSVFNQDKNLEKNAVQGILQTYSEFYPEKAEKYLDKDPSGKFSFKVSTDARGLVAQDFVNLVKDKPFEKIDKYIKEQNEYISTNHGILKQALDEGKITEDELFDLAEQSEREKALTFDVGIIPKDNVAIKEISGMATFIGTNAEIVDKQSGDSKSSKKSVSQEIIDRGGIDRWTYNPLDGTVDYWTKDGEIVRTDINKNGTKVVKEISGIITSTIDSYYKNDVNETSIPLPVSYIDEHGKVQTLKVKVVKQFDPVNKTIIKRIGIEEFQPDGNIRIRGVRPDQFINEMFAQIELFKGERIQQKPKDPNK